MKAKPARKLLAAGASSRYEHSPNYSGSPFRHHELRLYQEEHLFALTWREVGKERSEGDTLEGSTPGKVLARLSEAERSEEDPSLSRALAALVEEVYPGEGYAVKSESAPLLGSLRWWEADWWSGHEGRWQEVTIWEEPEEKGAYTALVAEYELGAKPILQKAWVRHGDAVSLARALAEISQGLYMYWAIALLLEAEEKPVEVKDLKDGDELWVYRTKHGVELRLQFTPATPGFPDPHLYRPPKYRVHVR